MDGSVDIKLVCQIGDVWVLGSWIGSAIACGLIWKLTFVVRFVRLHRLYEVEIELNLLF